MDPDGEFWFCDKLKKIKISCNISKKLVSFSSVLPSDSNVEELIFDGTIDNELSRRKVKLNHNDIVKFQKTRTAFNHMTVMYKKSKVIAAENYQDCPLIEDSYLWVRMIIHGAYCANIDDYLVYARTGKEMIARRGGWSYLKKYIAGRKKILNTGFINYWEYLETVIAQIVVAFVPSKIRFLIFQKTLRG